MKVNRYFIAFFSLFLFLSSCNFFPKHFIGDKEYLARVEKRFDEQRKSCTTREKELFDVFNQQLSIPEKEALMFLYAYMPLSDLADYDGEFFLKNVQTTLEIQDHFPWCKSIPEEVFRHFVLPIRVNNESLDSARWVFFNELKDRLKGMEMEKAALEVNHWCHEKVNYRGTDGRTSSPMNTVKNAFGRCGEESTFTVAAMRAAGIPARQCYTPRWAHSDDNHAWVEVWVKGKWHFLGACEPEPHLNMGWFAAPSLRTMLVSTNVYGEYFGPEEKLVQNRFFTRINLLPNYTKTKKIVATVTDNSGNPLPEVRVDFCLYNYAEFYPLAGSLSNDSGKVSFTTGYGDLVVWARKNNDYVFAKIDVRKSDEIRLVLKPGKLADNQEMVLVPPEEGQIKVNASEVEQQENANRLKTEDSLRNAYVSSFIDSAAAVGIASQNGLDPSRLWPLFRTSRGNWAELKSFVTGLNNEEKKWAIPFLESITEKDLHDVTAQVLRSHLKDGLQQAVASGISDDDYARYVLSPRIGMEYLREFRKQIRTAITFSNNNQGTELTKKIIEWVGDNIMVSDSANSYRSPISPGGVCSLRKSDPGSRDVFFVAACRTFGIPARIEPASGKPQIMNSNKWNTISFDPEKPAKEKGILVLTVPSTNQGFVPAYSSHFAIASLNDGFYTTLDYETDPVMTKFPSTIEIEEGNYRFITGNRLSDGTVLAKMEFFSLSAGENHKFEISLIQPKNGASSLGRLEKKLEVKLKSGASTLEKLMNGNALALLWLEPGKEPTRHVIAEIEPLRSEFDKLGAQFFIFLPTNAPSNFQAEHASIFPNRTNYSVESGNELLIQIEKCIKKESNAKFPVLVFMKPNGDLWYFSSGYTIGAGNELLKLFRM